jgi:predicted Zn-ribbon and HTH transcriptional regulator
MKDRRKQLDELYETYIEELENHTTPHKGMKAMIESVKAEIQQEEQTPDLCCGKYEGQRRDYSVAKESYGLNCYKCGNPYWSKEAFPKPQLCPVCKEQSEPINSPLTEEILPCPFCGEHCHVVNNDFGDRNSLLYRVRCNNPDWHELDEWASTPESAIKTWNKRFSQSQPVSMPTDEEISDTSKCNKCGGRTAKEDNDDK